MLVIGVLLLGAGVLAAGSMSRSEPTPMESILAETEATPVEVDASSWDITVTRNSSVESWIDFLSGRNAEKTHLWLERSGRYAPMIRAELRSRDMPQDLLYLALIESGFSPKAYSSAAAVGIWQFIAETGQRYGLEVSSEVDERRDPIKATRAALDYLEELHDRFGSWYLAAAAYNTGENRVDRILRERAGGARGSDTLFWTIAPYLPKETRNYVPLMLAAGHIAKDPTNYGFEDLAYQDPFDFETVWVPGPTTIAGVARAAGTDEEAIRDLNPQLLQATTPQGRGWSIRLPTGTRETFAANFPEIYLAEKLQVAAEKAAGRSYEVKAGETLTHIARRFGVSLSALESANRGVNPRRLQAGQSIAIPGSAKVAAAAGTAKSATVHKVKRGENLSVIANRYDVSVSQLQSWNRLGSRSTIQAGQQLKIGA
jgi:membrane-bound lytic murein transglycosylase D